MGRMVAVSRPEGSSISSTFYSQPSLPCVWFHDMFVKTRVSILLGIAFLSFPSLQAGDRTTEESFIPNFAVAGSYFSWGGESDFSNRPGTFSNNEFGITANVPIVMRDGFRLTAGVSYRRNSLEFTGSGFPFGTQSLDLERLDIPFNLWKDFNDRWKMWVRLQPGWYSDFNTVDSNDFILTSLALLSYQWTDTTRIAFGAYYSRDLGEERVLPALGFIFEPDPHWSLALTFPRAELAYAPSEDLLISARALLSGAGWNITDPAGGAADVDLNYRSIRVGGGIDARINGPWWAFVDAGVQLGQELTIEGAPYVFQQDLESSAYVTGGIRLRF